MDVLITGTADGQERTVVIECKDFDPKRTGPVGIGYVDALESKRRDVNVHVALICSNAGFTADATRKARRVGIGLIGVMRKGDKRIRILVPEELYTRRIKVESLTIALRQAGSPVNMDGVPFDAILYERMPIGNWIRRRVMLLLGLLQVPSGPVSVDRIDYHLRITGCWFAQQVTLDASAGVYDWLRRRVRLAPGPSQFHINNVDINAGEPIETPPDEELHQSPDLRHGEMALRLLAVDGLGAYEPAPELDRSIRADDLEVSIKGLPPDAYTSANA